MLLGEEGAERLSTETEDAELLSVCCLYLRRNEIWFGSPGTAYLTGIDTRRALIEEDLELFVLRDLSLDLCGSNAIPAVATPRSLDLAHLRTALLFHGETAIDRFVSLDAAQRSAAKELGLPV